MKTFIAMLGMSLLFLTGGIRVAAQEKSVAALTEAYRFESENSQLFEAYAAQAVKDGFPEVAAFFNAIAEMASVHADNFRKVLGKMGQTVSPVKPVIILKTTPLHVEEALRSVRIQSGVKYAEYQKTAESEQAKSAVKAFRWAKETNQEALPMFIRVNEALINNTSTSLPEIYWVCPTCGNLYDTPDHEKECRFCYTEKAKFVKIGNK